jgi:hypothetical protein
MNRPRWGDDLSMNSASVRMAIENDLGGLLEPYRFLNPRDPVADEKQSSATRASGYQDRMGSGLL